MTSKEIIRELIEKEMKKLEQDDCARPLLKNGIDKYDSPEMQEEHIKGYARYCKFRDIIQYLSQDKIETEISQHIPDWKELVKELIEQEIKQLQDEDLARSNAYTGIDRYDSQEELNARTKGFDRYSKLVKMNKRLDDDEKAQNKKRGILSWNQKQFHGSFLEDPDR